MDPDLLHTPLLLRGTFTLELQDSADHEDRPRLDLFVVAVQLIIRRLFR